MLFRSIFQESRRPIKLHHLDGSNSSILLTVGTVIPVNPLNSGDMLLANVSYQTRNAIMALKQQVSMTHDVMNEMMYQIREQHSFNLKMTDSVKWLCDVLEESQFRTTTSSDWCEFGSQALNTVSSLCYGIPAVGTAFACLFKNAAVLVDWYGESVVKSSRLDTFDIRRTAYFDNLPNFASTGELGQSLSKMEDDMEKINLLNDKLVEVDSAFYESEKWLLMNNHVDQGLNFYGLLRSDGSVAPNFLGVAFPVVTSGEKSVYWVAFDSSSKTCHVGASSCDHASLRKSICATIRSHLIGNSKTEYKIVKRSVTPMFIPDEEMIARVYELKRIAPYLSDDNDRCMGQIHGFLQLGGKVGDRKSVV